MPQLHPFTESRESEKLQILTLVHRKGSWCCGTRGPRRDFGGRQNREVGQSPDPSPPGPTTCPNPLTSAVNSLSVVRKLRLPIKRFFFFPSTTLLRGRRTILIPGAAASLFVLHRVLDKVPETAGWVAQ